MRSKSISPTLSATTSETRSPAPYAVASAALYFAPFRGRQFGSRIFNRAHRTVAIVRLRTMSATVLPRAGDDLALSRLVKGTMLPPTEPPRNW